MGLDNGFIMEIPRTEIPSFLNLPWDFPDSGDVEIAYWRKCWGVRELILSVLHPSKEGYEYIVESEDLNAILNKLIDKCFNKEWWENEGDSIWTFEEALPRTIIDNIFNLKWAAAYMAAHPDVKMYFYDSY